jgi:hypothetical protein
VKRIKQSAIEREEIAHLKHMETAIIPILVALAIFGFTLRINVENLILQTIISYFFSASLVLAILHLYYLIIKNYKKRLGLFFVDGIFLIILLFASISVIILYYMFGDMNLFVNTINKITGLTITVIINTALLLLILYQKFIPAFEEKIFPVLYKKYKLPKFKYKQKKKIKSRKNHQNIPKPDTSIWENEKCFVKYNKSD